MADDDEIDILGDFALDNLLSKNESELYDHSGLESHNSDELNCDCSSQWLLDHHSSGNSACWYSNHTDLCTDLSQNIHDINTFENQTSSENTITDDSGWTRKEKKLLESGIEIFGKSNARLAQFIGTKSPNEVKYYMKNFYPSVNAETILDGNIIEETVVTSDIVGGNFDENELLDDSEIPASIEEVIAAVSTAKPTIPINSKKTRKSSNSKSLDFEINYDDIPSGHSVLKNSIYKYSINNKNSWLKQKQASSVSKKVKPKQSNSNVKFKFRTKIKLSKTKPKKRQKQISITDVKTNIKSIIPNLNEEDVIKMKKVIDHDESETDVEIDVEHCNDENSTPDEEPIADSIIKLESETTLKKNFEEIGKTKDLVKQFMPKDLPVFSDGIMDQLMSMEVPSSELILAKDVVTELEQCVNYEFFDGRPTKTRERYLRIRNHILNTWAVVKPTYITKTSIRPGLKHCGDVNSIGRIHQFLEQIGAINFGCPQTNYVRPLYDLLLSNVPLQKEKNKDLTMLVSKPVTQTSSRPRFKKKFANDGKGGYTLVHDEKGDVINITIVSEEPIVKQKPQIKRSTIRLIYCKSFTEENPQKYNVHLYLSSLLLMDLHAHTSHSEVMGLIGGQWSEQSKTLTIMRYIPCRNIASSATHCDMCPISQAKAADTIHNENLDILGWFHSHPTFAPEPSQQDLDTQLSVQQWIGDNKPCIGLILSPFSAHGALIASPYQCLIVAKKSNFEDQYVPYKFKVDLISSPMDVNILLSQSWQIFNADYNVIAADRVDFNKSYFLDQSITYFDKFIHSIKMHLAKCSDINKMTCDSIIQGFTNICCNRL